MNEGKILKVTHQGTIDIGKIKISCAVLSNNERILVDRSLANAIGIKGSGAYWTNKKHNKGAVLPEYISANYLTPFISEKVSLKLSNPVKYIDLNGELSEGIPATCLIDICDIWHQAYEKGALHNKPNAELAAKNAYVIFKGFAEVGIISLVDEATGYQDERVKDALQQILDKFLLDEAKQYKVTFPIQFYKDIFKLNKWDWKPESAQKKPSVIGNWTNDLVYKRLAPGLLKELKIKNPKNEKGYREAKHFQFLTEQVGEPKLLNHFGGLHALAVISRNFRQFKEKVNQVFPKYGDNLKIPFDYDEDNE